MTREDAIYWIKNLAVLSIEKDMPQIEEALKMAVEALADRKDEPQTAECPFDDNIPCEWVCTQYGKCKYKTEPQTEVVNEFYANGELIATEVVEAEPQTERSE